MPGVVLEVLFVPRKAESLSVVRRAVESMDINLHICTEPAEVERLLFCHRYDGLILDHDDSAETILRALRQSPSSKSAIAIDIHDDSVNLQTVFSLGANFEVLQPITVDRVRRALGLAVGLMMLGRRRYYRHPVEIPAKVTVNGMQYDGWVTNVSEQGMGVRCDEVKLRSGDISVVFDLPKGGGLVTASGTIVWADQAGQAGCRVEQFGQGQSEYVDWISQLFHQHMSGTALPMPLAHRPPQESPRARTL